MARAALHDPWLTERMRNDTLLTRHERAIEVAVLAAMRDWLNAARTLVLGGSLTASTPDPDAVQASFVVWREGLEDKIEPAIGDAFGAGFNASLRTADVSVLPYQERHMQTVHDRLRLWPEGAFEDMRPELVQAVTLGESMGDTTKRVAGILDIDAPTRRLRGRITEVDGLLAAEDLTPARRRDLRALRKRLWQEHDTSSGSGSTSHAASPEQRPRAPSWAAPSPLRKPRRRSPGSSFTSHGFRVVTNVRGQVIGSRTGRSWHSMRSSASAATC